MANKALTLAKAICPHVTTPPKKSRSKTRSVLFHSFQNEGLHLKLKGLEHLVVELACKSAETESTVAADIQAGKNFEVRGDRPL